MGNPSTKNNGKQYENLTIDRVRELLDYDPETGIFTRRIYRGGTKSISEPAGYTHSKGYRIVRVDLEMIKGHRLAWFMFYGEWPKKEIDHINGNKDDNRIANLRQADRSENMRNCGMKSNNTSGFKGCRLREKGWQARITLRGKQIHLGFFGTALEASAAYEAAARELHGEFTRVKQPTRLEQSVPLHG